MEASKKDLVKFMEELKKHSENIDYIMEEFESYELRKIIVEEMKKYDDLINSFDI